MYLIAQDTGNLFVTDRLSGLLNVAAHRPLGEDESSFAARYGLQDGEILDLYPGMSDAEVEAALAAAVDEPMPSQPVLLTRLQFMDLFTQEELVTLYTAAKTEVALEVFLDQFRVTEQIALNDPKVIAGLQALVDLGIVSAERVQEMRS